VPAGLDVGGVKVVLGVLDPAGAEGQLLGVLKVLVAGAVLADEAAVLGITWEGGSARCSGVVSDAETWAREEGPYRYTVRENEENRLARGERRVVGSGSNRQRTHIWTK
jgi:hypothetical protein